MEEQARIPYEEYKAITELMHAHVKTHEGRLRALVAFGNLVTRGDTFDIDLLEVVENWRGETRAVFGSSSALILRGQLRLHLLTPEEFEQPESNKNFARGQLLARVREGYEVIYEDPPGYARDVLAPAGKGTTSSNPLEFLMIGDVG